MASNFKNKIIDNITKYLARAGYEMIKEAQARKDVGNKSYNQRDAYGALVYYEKKLKRKVHLGATMAKEPHVGYGSIGDGYGREWLDDFANDYIPKTDGFCLVVVNATFYGAIQETKYKYKIISQEYSRMEDLASQFKGAKISIL